MGASGGISQSQGKSPHVRQEETNPTNQYPCEQFHTITVYLPGKLSRMWKNALLFYSANFKQVSVQYMYDMIMVL